MNELDFTGERVVPGKVDKFLWAEHLSRYMFAAQWAAGKRVLDAGCGAGFCRIRSHRAPLPLGGNRSAQKPSNPGFSHRWQSPPPAARRLFLKGYGTSTPL